MYGGGLSRAYRKGVRLRSSSQQYLLILTTTNKRLKNLINSGELQMQTRILITNITANNDGFGVDPVTGEGVYIPPGVTLAADLTVGEHRMAHLVPNGAGRRVPHLAAFIPPIQLELPLEAESVRSGFEVDGRTLEVLGGEQAYYLVAEVATELGLPEHTAQESLTRLFALGEVARADVYHKSATEVKHTLWAADVSKFL